MTFDDLTHNRRFDLGVLTLSADEITAFAADFDPQPQHVDEEAARATVLGGLCASGWHTCAALNRLLVAGLLAEMPDVAVLRFDDVRWKAPVFADRRYPVTGEITASEADERVLSVTAATPDGLAAALLKVRLGRATAPS